MSAASWSRSARRLLAAAAFAVGAPALLAPAAHAHAHARSPRAGPKVVYSTYLAAGVESPAYSLAVDRSGSAYITGQSSSPRLPVTPGALGRRPPPRGAAGAFVTKLSPNGRRLAYSTYLGGSGVSVPGAIAVDGKGAAYVGGWAYPGGVPTTPGALQPQPLGEPISGFVAKLAPNGRRLVYSTYLAGPGAEGGEVDAIAVDRRGDAYVAGQTESAGFPVTPGALRAPGPPVPGSELAGDVFVSKLDPSGHLLYSAVFGGSAGDTVGGIAIDRQGDAYLAGSTASRDFPVTPGAFQSANEASEELSTGFVAKLDPTGSHLLYSTYLGGHLGDEAEAIAVDARGDAYVSGAAGSSDFPTTAGVVQRRPRGFENAFVAVLAPGGGRLLRSTLVGKETFGRDIALDRAGDPYLVGFRTAPERHGRDRGQRGFLAELNPALTRIRLWRGLGGNHARAASLALGPGGDVYAAGGSGPGLAVTNVLAPRRRAHPRYPSAFVTRLKP